MRYVLEFHNVSKRYVLGGLRGSLREGIGNLFSKIAGKDGYTAPPDLWALRDITFTVNPGEALGIIGPNGAGKTTTLKLATFVTQPASGQIVVRGRTSALIELGAGFHPDLTGRENIYLNGTILGLRQREIQQRFDEIVAFSELERFLDTPVKRYSSGMYARLGFAVAAYVNPDILIVDEVLAVGDLAFQAKCLSRLAQMKEAGTAIIMVSHMLPRLRRLCNRVILLHRGQIVLDGDADDVISIYETNPEYSSNLRNGSQPEIGNMADGRPQSAISGDSPVAITNVTFLDGEARAIDCCQPGDRLVVRIGYYAKQRVENPVFEIWLHTADGTPVASHTTDWDKYSCNYIEGEGHIDLIVDPVCLTRGKYSLSVAITAQDGVSRYDWRWRSYWLGVQSDHYAYGTIFLPHEWRLSATKRAASGASKIVESAADS